MLCRLIEHDRRELGLFLQPVPVKYVPGYLDIIKCMYAMLYDKYSHIHVMYMSS